MKINKAMKFEELNTLLNDRMKYFNVPGISMTYFESGMIHWKKTAGVLQQNTNNKIDENSIFHACSISKMITALSALCLVQEGVLNLNTPVNELLTSWKIPTNKFTGIKEITLADILAHQGGFYDAPGSFEPYKSGTPIPTLLELLKGTGEYNLEEVHPQYTPQIDFSYSDGGYCVIAQLIKDVTGESLPQIAQKYIFTPLALQSTFFWEVGKEPKQFPKTIIDNCAIGHNKHGNIVDELRAQYPNTEGAGLWSTPTELTTIVLDVLDSYHHKKGKILTTEMAERLLTPYGDKSFIGLGVFLDSKQGSCFSQGWGVGMQCKLKFFPKTNTGLVVMTNSDPGCEQNKSLIGEIIELIL